MNNQIRFSKPALQSLVAFMELPRRFLFHGALLTTQWIIVAHSLVGDMDIHSGNYFVEAKIGLGVTNDDHAILEEQQAPWNKQLSFFKVSN